jgi:hypothetical protein
MKRIEQAIYTSAETDRGAEYQVVARSADVCDADARELAVWEPSRDAMLDAAPDAESFNFHPLPSGAYCVSRSTSAGWEQGGGRRVHTHCLIVPTTVLARFANNPFSLIQAMTDRGLWRNSDEPCTQLDPFSLPGGASPVNQELLQQLAVEPGAKRMAALIQRACGAICLALGGASRPSLLMAGLFNCLPPELRLEFSFTTGLRFSPWRPFRIVALSDDPAERLWVSTYPNVTVLELGRGAMMGTIPLDGWAMLIERALVSEHIPFLAFEVSKKRFELTPNDLSALGLQLLEELDAMDIAGGKPSGKSSLPREQLAHTAHQRFEKSKRSATATATTAPKVEHSSLHSPEILEKLEYLDDLVYEAISGKTDSMGQLRDTWPKLLDELGDTLLAESREQYLRYALSIWTECAQGGSIRDPIRAIQALDVLCLLFDEPM